jgi:NTP pyrophosphatase (non-canonical NTP hydrolase)
MDLDMYTKAVYAINVSNGWRDNPEEKDPTFAEAMMLLVTEMAEACDAWRRWGFDDATEPGWIYAKGKPPPKPEGVGSEFADILIRLLDDCHLFGFKLSNGVPWAPVEGTRASLMGAMWNLTGLAVKAGEAHTFGSQAEVAGLMTTLYRHLAGYAQVYGIDLRAEVDRKLEYNATRGWRHGGKRM